MLPMLIVDTAAFIYQFYVPEANAALNMTIITIWLLNVTLFMQFWQRKFFGPEKEINKNIKELDVKLERAKLVE